MTSKQLSPIMPLENQRMAKEGLFVKCETITNRSLEALAPVFASDDVLTIVNFLQEWPAHQVEPLLASSSLKVVKSAIICLGLNGSIEQNNVLAGFLRNSNLSVARLAEESLWQVWMRAGSPVSIPQLASAIEKIRNGEFDAAVQELKTMSAAEPNFAECRHQLGLAYSFLNMFKEATAAYEQALELNPHHFQAAAGLGNVFTERGNLRRALHWYRRALRMNPHLEEVREAIELIQATLKRRRAGT